MRLDLYLFSHGYAESRQKAKVMIEEGVVFCGGKQLTKASLETEEGAPIEIRGEVCPYVGRGGFKLEGALQAFGVNAGGFSCVDIGSSTGGFTDCLLQHGAARVCAVDSGTGQLAEKLRKDNRVDVHEGFNARNLDTDLTGGPVDLAVCDVSFISVTYMFEPVLRVLKSYDPETKSGSFLALIKPQFEAGRENIGKNGIIRDERVHLRVTEQVVKRAAAAGLSCLGLAPSPIKGGDGNREFLAHFAKDAEEYADLRLSDGAYLKELLKEAR